MCYNNKVKILGIDYGDRHIGFAETDPLEIISSPLTAVQVKSMKQAIEETQKIVSRDNIGYIVIGLPLMTDGSEGERASKTRAFGRVVSRVTELDVEYIDERYTTCEAEEFLLMGNIKKKDMKKYTDKLSAQIILQSWLDRKK